MTRLQFPFLTVCTCLATTAALTVDSRRAFLNRAPIVATSMAAGLLLQHDFGCNCFHCVAVAYERRDVGGEAPGPETYAMNLQAYETNNRLEREGFKLETQEEQKAALTAALSDYSYSPTTTKSNGKSKEAEKSKATK